MTTVTGVISNSSGSLLTVFIQFKPLSTPQVSGSLVTTNDTISCATNPNDGTFSQQLDPGLYQVTIVEATQTTFNIAVPSGSSTVVIGDIVVSTLPTLPGVAPYTVWNGHRAGSIEFDPISDAPAPTCAPITMTGGHQGGIDLFGYVVIWTVLDTTGNFLTTCFNQLNQGTNTIPHSPNNATRVTLPTPPSGVVAVNICRTCGTGVPYNLYLLAQVAPGVGYYDDWESNADFAARVDVNTAVPTYNTTAGLIYSTPNNAIAYFSSSGFRVLSKSRFDDNMDVYGYVTYVNSNTRIKSGQGLELYCSETGLWHPIGLIGDPPSLEIGPGGS